MMKAAYSQKERSAVSVRALMPVFVAKIANHQSGSDSGDYPGQV